MKYRTEYISFAFLFGSSIKHHDIITLRISPAYMDRDLNYDRYYAENHPYIEINMSQSQFAQAITSLNMGAGVPVTLRQINGEYIEPCPFVDTGSCTLLEACGKNILIDCGMEQGGDTYENCELPIAPSEIDAICLTHAHIDHSGMIPAMVAKGYAGPVYCTEATHRLCNIMLQDSAHIQEQEAEWQNRKAERSGYQQYVPVYTVADALESLKLFEGHGYNKPIEIFEGVTINFCDAGHLLGSSSIHITVNETGEERTVLFSGDLGNIDRPLIRNPQNPPYADYVVIESTYGDRVHGERPDYIAQLTKIMQETFSKGGNLVIPSFAIGRTQELLYLFRTIKEQGLVKGHENFIVYVDSPLAVEATKIYQDNLMGYYDEETLALVKQGINPISFPGLRLSVTTDESRAINFDMIPKVINVY